MKDAQFSRGIIESGTCIWHCGMTIMTSFLKGYPSNAMRAALLEALPR